MQSSLLISITLPTIVFSSVLACGRENASRQNLVQTAQVAVPEQASPSSPAVPEHASPPSPSCDPSLWNHVYNPKRLTQLSPCLSATGVISESDADADGDQHFLLRLDPGQDSLVNHRNAKKKGGDLVLEIVCANPTTMKKVKKACTGYTNPIAIPKVGAHVRVTGSYVIDTHNGWTEIHPVSRMAPL
jgi:hypothetical protein